MHGEMARAKFIALMNPLTFLDLAKTPTKFKSVERVQRHLDDGGSIGPLYLEGRIKGLLNKEFSIIGHEGRNRAKSSHLRQPHQPVPVFFDLGQKMSPDEFAGLSQGAWKESEEKVFISGPLFKCFFHAGKRYGVEKSQNEKGENQISAREVPYSRDISISEPT